MSVFRLQNNTPEVYVNKSRDFQLLCRVFDCINLCVRQDINSMITVMDTNTCPNRLLQLLQTRLGFFTDHEYNDDDIRFALMSFAKMAKNKGSKKSIEMAVNVFLRVIQLKAPSRVIVDQENHTIQIGIKSTPVDTTFLDEILRYILPTGYFVRYYFYKEVLVSSEYTTRDSAGGLLVAPWFDAQVIGSSGAVLDNRTIPSSYKTFSNSVGTTSVYPSSDRTAEPITSSTGTIQGYSDLSNS